MRWIVKTFRLFYQEFRNFKDDVDFSPLWDPMEVRKPGRSIEWKTGYPVLQSDRIIDITMNLFMSATWKSRKNYQIWMMLLHT